jgi:protein SCO1/2
MISPLWSPGDAWGEIPSLDRIRVLSSPRPIADAELTDQFGEPFRLSSLGGRVAFVLFGFTNCPDVCPLSMERLRELNQSGELEIDDVAYVLISVDGERDTPDQMKAFIEKYSDDFIGLTGEPEAVRYIASEFSAPFFKGHEDHGGHYDVTHSPQIFVLDQEGRLRAEAYNAPLESMVGIADALIAEGP